MESSSHGNLCYGCKVVLNIFTLREFKDEWDLLIEERSPEFKHSRIAVNSNQVASLYECLEEINFARWGEDHWVPILDGVQWSIAVYIDGRSYKSGGSNAYPEGFDKLLECLIDIFGCEELEQYRGCCGEDEVAE